MRWGLLVIVAAAFSLPGCLNDFDEQRTNQLYISKVDVSAPRATSGSVELVVHTTLDNDGGQSGSVRIEATAYDTGTQLLAARESAGVGRIQRDRTLTVEVTLDVPRAAGYRIDVILFEDERAHRTATTTVSNVEAIPPNLYETGLRVSAMDFEVRNASGGRVLITASPYLTNEADNASRPLRMQVKAREVTTGLLADEAWTDLAPIGPEETRIVNVTLDVPNAYNYAVEATIWDANYIVETGSGNVQLLPMFTQPSGASLVVASPNIGDFDRYPGGSDPQAKRTPGAGIAILVAALAVALVAWRRR